MLHKLEMPLMFWIQRQRNRQVGRRDMTHTLTLSNPLITVIISSILGEMNTTFYTSFKEPSTELAYLSVC